MGLGAQSTRLDVFSPNASIAYDAFGTGYSVAIDFFTLQALNTNLDFGFNVALAELRLSESSPKVWALFPLQIIYSPVNYNELLWVYFYAGGKVIFEMAENIPHETQAGVIDREKTGQFMGTFGVRFVLIPRAKPKAKLRSHSVSVFMEYSTFNTFSVGISLPAGGLSYLVSDWLDILNAEFESIIPPKEPRTEGGG